MSLSCLRRAASMLPQALLNSDESSGQLLQRLSARGVRILSSGGTAKSLAAEGVPVETVEIDLTASPTAT